MPYAVNELVANNTLVTPQPRIFPEAAQPKTFANVGGGPTLAMLTPVAVLTATGKWTLFINGAATGAQLIKGFIITEGGLKLDATNDVLGVVMLSGRIHIDDIPLVGYTRPQLEAAIIASRVRDQGIIVEGMANFS